ncbi:MAG: hypothetical protein ABIR56_11220 [Polaromonas sp.]
MNVPRLGQLLASACLAGHCALAAQPASASDERLRRFMAQARGEAARDASTVSAERLQQRADLLQAGELALSRRRWKTRLRHLIAPR